MARIQRRVELWSHYPLAHQEDMQVLRYAPGQEYGCECSAVHAGGLHSLGPRHLPALTQLRPVPSETL